MTDSQANGPAADFELLSHEEKKVSLKEFGGKKNVVLYFYPKDDTPGCTKEAQAFRDLYEEFQAQDTEVLGVSKDSIARHVKFRQKYDLPFPLLSDEEGVVVEDYGVWVEKNMYGRKYMGIERATFLIDKSGKLARVWRKVKVKGHVEEVLEAVKSL